MRAASWRSESEPASVVVCPVHPGTAYPQPLYTQPLYTQYLYIQYLCTLKHPVSRLESPRAPLLVAPPAVLGVLAA